MVYVQSTVIIKCFLCRGCHSAVTSRLCQLTVIWHFDHKYPQTTVHTKHTLPNCSFKLPISPSPSWLASCSPSLASCRYACQVQDCHTHKILSPGQPTYLHHLLQPYIPLRSIRSASQQLLHIPPLRTNFSCWAFRHAAPIVWNDIPLTIRESGTLNTFKRRLKSHLFNNH